MDRMLIILQVQDSTTYCFDIVTLNDWKGLSMEEKSVYEDPAKPRDKIADILKEARYVKMAELAGLE
jgi:hypothetical protein